LGNIEDPNQSTSIKQGQSDRRGYIEKRKEIFNIKHCVKKQKSSIDMKTKLH
jgi:hypothetical protein